MKPLWFSSILLQLCVIFWDLQLGGCYKYNLDRCRNCSVRKDVACRVQQMNLDCFPGYDKDIWKDERKWPGAARDLQGRVKRQDNSTLMVASFKWKPPYDSSVDELKGFQIQVNVRQEASLSHPVCFFANLSGTNWTQLTNIYDTDFIFNCLESTEVAKVTVYITSVPMPTKKHKRSREIVNMVPGFSWKPKMKVWTTFSESVYEVHLWFSPLYPGANYHRVQLHSSRLENSTDLHAPFGNFTFQNVPCKKNYTVQIRPYYKQRALVNHYFSSQTVEVGDCVAPLIRPLEPVTSKLVTLVCIPILLVIVGTITAVFFFRRDASGCKLRRRYQPTESCELAPNNADCTMILPVYCDDSQQLREAIYSLKTLLHSVRGSKVQFTEENLMESFTSDFLKSNSCYQVVIISSKSLIQIHSALDKIRSHLTIHSLANLNGNLSHESQAFLHCATSLDTIHNFVTSHQQRIKKPILISFFPDIETKILNSDIQEQFVLSDIVDVQGNVECIIRDAEIRKLVNFLHDDDETMLQEESGSSTPESRELGLKLRELYKTEMRNNTSNKRLEESLRTYTAANDSSFCNHQEMVTNYHMTSHFDNRCLNVNPVTWSLMPCNPKETMIDPYDIHFTHPPYMEGDVPLHDSRTPLDSDYASMVQLDQERVYLAGNVTDFIPPVDSDTDSVDNQSLCQKMLEFNQRNLTKWNTVAK